ncbi:2-amino-4-hydroxy-6-hydroxymethyldihydropteridine diphosphokinase [Thioalkalivibrio sp. HK1]|uniref:2-amino-4-hydroxy-6- hydroxymethyldihydropteridine diphosphokinase n=1 Tax=Thioalkalivibrio sp. HK1 TaxID=1469245 RepID=UPI0004722DD8|nr:2-amino-4-hydroxy-6-hydroxymethyldihydropteridine diphosphokinase [Thioalkalivibrio sp. HK1]
MNQAFVGIGSNIRPEYNVPRAIFELQASFGEVRASGIYESPAIGFDGPAFHNLVAVFRCDLEAKALIESLRTIERRCGRKRDPSQTGLRSRTVDIDLLLLGDHVQQGADGFELPHPDILEYPFVLAPLAEIAPDGRHPVIRRTFDDLWRECEKRGSALMRRLERRSATNACAPERPYHESKDLPFESSPPKRIAS